MRLLRTVKKILMRRVFSPYDKKEIEMIIIPKEKPTASLTYTPFENIGELLKQTPKKKKEKEDKK